MNYARRTVPYIPALRSQFSGVAEVPRGLGPARIQPSQPDPLGSEQGMYVRLPGANFPPAGAIAVDTIGDANIAPAGTATLVTIKIPDTYRFRMVGIGFGADDETALRFLTWNIQLDQVATSGYVNVTSAVGSIRQLADIFMVVGSSLQVTIVANSDPSAVLTYRFICRVRGHFWSDKESRA
jgi:hypothetical protein